MSKRIVCLPGDGIGPEVAAEAVRVLEALPLDADVESHLFGGAAIDAVGDPLPPETLAACRAADAVLLGAVGGPKWDGGTVRPEAGLIGLRKELDVYANLRPAVGDGVDLLIVRELVGGLYYGARGVRDDGTVFDTCEYHPSQVERIARRGFELARGRGGRLLSVDKSNVLDTSRMWRRVVSELAADYPDVELRHGLVDSVAMQLVMDPGSFDTLVMENTFGDILSDVAAGVTGGLGLASSASLGDSEPRDLRAGARLGARHRGHRHREPDGDAALAGAPARARAGRAGARAFGGGRGRARDGGVADAGSRWVGDDLRVRRRRSRRAGRWRRDARRLSRAARARTARAATALLAPPGAGTEPLASFIAVVEATVGAEVSMGVLPIENSLHGPVGETHDLLYEAPVSIVSEVTLPIVHCLVAKPRRARRGDPHASLAPGRLRPVPRPDPLAERQVHPLVVDLGRGARGGRVGRSARSGARRAARPPTTSGSR